MAASLPMLGPAWIAPAGTLSALRRRRAAVAVAQRIFRGDWAGVLLGLGHTQHHFAGVRRHGGRIGVLVERINIIKVAMLTHADVLAGREPIIDLPDEFVEQWDAIEAVRRRSFFAARFHEASLKVAIEGSAALRVDITASSPRDVGAVIIVERNTVAFPMNHAGPDAQPTIWERRWIIERPEQSSTKTMRYLRVERHRVDRLRGGIVENEAYEAESADTLTGLETLTPVSLERAVGADAPPGLRETGLDRPAITELVGYRIDDEPFPLIDEHDLSLIDQCAKAFSDLARTHALHASPKVRVPESMIDPDTGAVNGRLEAIIDPNREFEYVRLEAQLDQMLTFMERCVQWLMVQVQMAQALIGFKVGGGAAAETYDKLVLDATPTLSRANRAAVYCDAALERVWTQACRLESALPMRGFDCHDVSVETRPSLPKDKSQRIREQAEALAAGLTSEIDAIEEVHGARRAAGIIERITEDRRLRSLRESAAFSAALPAMPPPGPAPADDHTPIPLSAGGIMP